MLILILVVLAVTITHELGHFFAAKILGVKVKVFSLFFWVPRRLKKYLSFSWNGVRYQVGLLPLGGYVELKGMFKWMDGENPKVLEERDKYQSDIESGTFLLDCLSDGEMRRFIEKEIEESSSNLKRIRDDTVILHDNHDDDALANKKIWQRMVVMAAGPLANLILAMVCFAAAYAMNEFSWADILNPGMWIDSWSNSVILLLGYMMFFMAISNLLPFPMLDGGHIFFLALEKIRGKPISLVVYSNICSVAMIGYKILLIASIAFLFFASIK